MRGQPSHSGDSAWLGWTMSQLDAKQTEVNWELAWPMGIPSHLLRLWPEMYLEKLHAAVRENRSTMWGLTKYREGCATLKYLGSKFCVICWQTWNICCDVIWGVRRCCYKMPSWCCRRTVMQLVAVPQLNSSVTRYHLGLWNYVFL